MRDIGNQSSDLKPDDRKKQRQITVQPLVEAETLRVFLNDGEVPLDNNVTEGALRSFCLHKHAWKLIDSIDGAKSSAIIIA